MGKRTNMSKYASTEQNNLMEDKARGFTVKDELCFQTDGGGRAETPCKGGDVQRLHVRESSVFLGNSHGLVGGTQNSHVTDRPNQDLLGTEGAKSRTTQADHDLGLL